MGSVTWWPEMGSITQQPKMGSVTLLPGDGICFTRTVNEIIHEELQVKHSDCKTISRILSTFAALIKDEDW